MITTYRFEELKLSATRYWKDENGKRRQETKQFFQTLNPYNKNRDGLVKTRSEIWEELHAARAAWLESFRAKEGSNE
jgi:hypothetical protein